MSRTSQETTKYKLTTSIESVYEAYLAHVFEQVAGVYEPKNFD